MRTILISPSGHLSDPRYMRVPLGLLYVAAVLEGEGHDVRVISVDEAKFTDQEVADLIRANSPDVVGITSVTCNYRNAAKYARLVKDIDPRTTVVMGGVHVSFTARTTMEEYRDIDFVVVGEGEITAKELWAELDRAKGAGHQADFSRIQGLVFRRAGELVETGPRGYIQNLDSIPWPARHLVPVTGYKNYNVEAHIFASRGCAFRCKFCLIPHTEGGFRKRNPRAVADEIEYLHKTYGYFVFKFVDNSFSTDRATIKQLCDELIKRRLNILWRCQTRIDLVDRDLMKLMRAAGCEEILVGVESASDRILNKVYGKGMSLNRVLEVFSAGRELGLVVTPSFVLGYPDETPEELEATKELIIQLYENNYRHPRMCFLTPFPGSTISDDVFGGELNQFLEVTDWDKYTHICPTLRTKYMSRHELARIYVEVLAEITARSDERMRRIWPEEEHPREYSSPAVEMYKMKDGIIQRNQQRVKMLSSLTAGGQ